MFKNLLHSNKEKVKTNYKDFEIIYKHHNKDFSLEEKILYTKTILEAYCNSSFLTRENLKDYINEDKKESLTMLKKIANIYSVFG